MPVKSTKLLSLVLSFCLILEQSAFAQTLDLSHYFANPAKPALPSDKFRPLHLRYLGYDNLSQDFKILLDKGDTKKADLDNKTYLEENTQTLLKYFFIGLALPNDKFWVNLRPDAPDNILDPDLEKTDIGRIFLEADVQLKKDTAGFTSPQTSEGKTYWDKLYKRAGELFGTENITIPTITRPWIVPNEIIIREAPDNAYIYKATLKVMLEEDYLTSRGGSRTAPTSAISSQQYEFNDPRLKELNEYSTQLIRELIIPKLTYQVNTSKRYAPLRQVYYSLILAQWFKQKYKGKETPYSQIIDSNNLFPAYNLSLITSHSYSKDTYFKQYQQSFKDGEYNLQEPIYTPMGQSVRRYVSGGIKIISSPVNIIADKPMPKAQYLFPARMDKGEISFASSAVTNDFVSLPVVASSLKKLSFYNALVAALGKIEGPHYYYGLTQDDYQKQEVKSLFDKDYIMSTIAENNFQVTPEDVGSIINFGREIHSGVDNSSVYLGVYSYSFKGNAIEALITIKRNNPELALLSGSAEERNIYPLFLKLPDILRPFATNSYMIECLTKALSPDYYTAKEGIQRLASNTATDAYDPTLTSLSYPKELLSRLFLYSMEEGSEVRYGDFKSKDERRRDERRKWLLSLFASPVNFFEGFKLFSPTKEFLRDWREKIENNNTSQEEFKVVLNKLSPEGLMWVKKVMFAHPQYFTFEELAIFFPEENKFILEEDGVRLKFWSEDIMPKDEVKRRFTEIMKSVFKPFVETILPEDAMLLPRSRAILAVDKDDKVIGFLHYTTGGFINEVVVLPGTQRRGVGSRMLKAASYDLARIGNGQASLNIASDSDLLDDAWVPQKKFPVDFYRSFSSSNKDYSLKEGSASLGPLFPGSPSELLFPDEMVQSAAAKAFGSVVGEASSSISGRGKSENLDGIAGSRSSPPTSTQDNLGGIAFNALPIQTESVASSPMGAFSGIKAFQGDLDAEWGQIQTVFNAGIRPSVQRISEYTAAAASFGLAADKIDQVRGMLADILRRDEEDEKLPATQPAVKKLLSALELR